MMSNEAPAQTTFLSWQVKSHLTSLLPATPQGPVLAVAVTSPIKMTLMHLTLLTALDPPQEPRQGNNKALVSRAANNLVESLPCASACDGYKYYLVFLSCGNMASRGASSPVTIKRPATRPAAPPACGASQHRINYFEIQLTSQDHATGGVRGLDIVSRRDLEGRQR
ncbi:hypothetical protein E2C01_027857 [Portunus trituberculatus]|uniref:Uncharacterized protein n=1 Tax=Portunus trituberculatus TaxID=210409 RepID=A0A5B7EMP2_PORTR|nr:hypothetical protein [Portunus trituberculatus]